MVELKTVALSQFLFGNKRLAKRELPGVSPRPCLVLGAHRREATGETLPTGIPILFRSSKSGWMAVTTCAADMPGISKVLVKL